MHNTQSCVTIARSIDEDAQTGEVVDIGEVPAAHYHLLIDRVIVLRSSVDGGFDTRLVKVLTND